MQMITARDVEYVYRVARVLSFYADEEDPEGPYGTVAYVEDVKVRKTAAGARSIAERLIKKHGASKVITQAGVIQWWHPKYGVDEITAAAQAANVDIEPARVASLVQLVVELYNTPAGMATEANQKATTPAQIDASATESTDKGAGT